MNTSNGFRAAAVLLVTFVAGAAAGAAGYRGYAQSHLDPPTQARRVEGRRAGEPQATVEADRIPLPIEALGPSREEEERLREIARRWRPQAARAVENIRVAVSDLENDMFAEMLCVISKDKQDRYLASLQENGADNIMIEKRFRLVRSDQCGAVRERRFEGRR
jgi:hypothetical protein